MFANLYKKKMKGKKDEGNDKEANEGVLNLTSNGADTSTGTTSTKKKRKRPPKKKKEYLDQSPNNRGNNNYNNHNKSNYKKYKSSSAPSQKAIELSSQLKSLSTQKRLQEALDLYYHPSNDGVRDEYHACAMIDCCGRSGNIKEGEKIIQQLQNDYIAEGRNMSSGRNNNIRSGPIRQINVQTKTALLKGYVHSGMIKEASLLYKEMMNMKKVWDRPNVRTLNTLLRGCLWSAATTFYESDSNTKSNTNNYKIHGGVITSEQVWPSSSIEKSSRRQKHEVTPTIVPDLSSYEYSITLLSQALRVDEAESRIKLLQDNFKITCTSTSSSSSFTNGHDVTYMSEDPSALETLAVSFISLARACALLGRKTDGQKYAHRVLSTISSITSFYNNGTTADRSNLHNNNKDKDNKVIHGGKRAWKSTSSTYTNNNDDERGQQQESRRAVSNKLFRSHRLQEMESEANMIINSCKCDIDSGSSTDRSSIDLPFYLMTRLLYFNGGGTTDLSAIESGATNESNGNGREKDQFEDQNPLFDSLWSSFGLAAAIKEAYPKIDLPKSGQILNKKYRHKINKTLDFDMTMILQNDGFINFSKVFSKRRGSGSSSSNNDNGNNSNTIEKPKQRPLYLELGAGFGEWAVYQAQNNPSCDYAAVELRSDRVSQMFTKSMLNEVGTPLENMCSIGSECGHLLRHRIKQGSVSKIFINHPEPPTQTFGSNLSVTNSIAAGGDEPAHMLNSETLVTAIKCLDEKTGELVIVTDNRWYAKLLCSTLLKVMSKNEKIGLYNKKFDGKSAIRQIEAFHQIVPGTSRTEKIFLHEGRPNEAIGHCTTRTKNQGGSSYFDRLWRSGAGTHAEVEKRFIICMSRSPSQRNESYVRKDNRINHTSNNKKKSKKPKKRNTEKQRLRNEKRLLKKKQAQEEND